MHAVSAPVLLFPVSQTDETKVETSTELKPECLSQTAKLVSLGLMAKNLGHEINSPVSLLMAKLENLSERTASRTMTEETLEAELERLLAATHRLAKMTKSLRAMGSDGNQRTPSIFFLNQALQQALNLIQEKMNRHGIQLNHSVDANLIVEGQPGDLSHAFLNLFSECIRALSQTPEPRIQIEALRIDSGIRVEIRDNRSNEEMETRTQIPKPILNVTELSAAEGQIQLAVAAEIFRDHQGRFYSDSRLNEHVFVLELPDFKKRSQISEAKS